jgi:hypothetical protein
MVKVVKTKLVCLLPRKTEEIVRFAENILNLDPGLGFIYKQKAVKYVTAVSLMYYMWAKT